MQKPITALSPRMEKGKLIQKPVNKAKLKEEAMRATKRAREAAAASKKREEELKRLEQQEVSLAQEAQKKAAVLLNKAKDFSSGLSWEKLSSQLKSAVKKPSEDSKVQVATVRGGLCPPGKL